MEINHIPASFAARRLTRSWSAGGRPVRKTEMVRARLLARYLARSRACCDEQHNDKRISEAVYSGRLIDSHYYGSERTSASARAQILAPSRRERQRLRLIKNSCFTDLYRREALTGPRVLTNNPAQNDALLPCKRGRVAAVRLRGRCGGRAGPAACLAARSNPP